MRGRTIQDGGGRVCVARDSCQVTWRSGQGSAVYRVVGEEFPGPGQWGEVRAGIGVAEGRGERDGRGGRSYCCCVVHVVPTRGLRCSFSQVRGKQTINGADGISCVKL